MCSVLKHLGLNSGEELGHQLSRFSLPLLTQGGLVDMSNEDYMSQ